MQVYSSFNTDVKELEYKDLMMPRSTLIPRPPPVVGKALGTFNSLNSSPIFVGKALGTFLNSSPIYTH